MKKIVLAALAACFVASASQATVLTFAGPSATDIDGPSTQNYSFNVDAPGTIQSLAFSIATSGSYADDITFSLSHLGQTVVFYIGRGDSFGSQINATFTDSASGAAPFNGSAIGTFTPANSFAAFNGLAAGGTYILSTIDTVAAGDRTALSSSSLQVTTSDVPEPASWAMFIGGFGLVGGVLRHRKLKPRLA